MRTALLIAAMLAIPIVPFLGGAWLMTDVSGREPVDSKPLNKRWGYAAKDVREHWTEIEGKQGTAGLESELHLLRLDLAFPMVYGVSLALSLLIGWTLVGRPFSPLWCLIPVAIGMVADWLENLSQIRQLKLFMMGEEMSAAAIRIASAATIVKLGALTVCALGVGLLILGAIREALSANRP